MKEKIGEKGEEGRIQKGRKKSEKRGMNRKSRGRREQGEFEDAA